MGVELFEAERGEGHEVVGGLAVFGDVFLLAVGDYLVEDLAGVLL